MLSRSSSYWWREERSLSRRRLGPGASSGASALGIILLNHVTFFKDFPKVFAPCLTPRCLFLPPLISFLLPSCRPYARPNQRGDEGGEGRRERRRERRERERNSRFSPSLSAFSVTGLSHWASAGKCLRTTGQRLWSS